MFRGAFWLASGWLSLLFWATTPVLAQTEEEEKKPPRSEGFNDTLVRMKIKREEEAHKKLVKSSQQAADIAERLKQHIQGKSRDRLDRGAEKKLKEIEKAAKQIRNNVGGSNDDDDFEVPKTLEEAVNRLNETSQLLSQQMEKTSRHMISAPIIVSASDMLRLVKILRGYIK
jgi:flagellar biosynthesis chaperone FliJ